MLQADRKNKSRATRAEQKKGSINQYNQSSSHTSYPNPSFISGSPETVLQSDTGDETRYRQQEPYQ
ncbi:uncharacterized protein BDR25DRAFT_354744 [Lindgomyces ingoldianus]|uniref:Uncharacterized protein n=1 Tax=Lindgomyces ingoldianus TaxID=673940 RepID=A0ACB6QWT1_9PLEO|nr:uncharacterized protein BDR25DRAFT_354744 [Lindgomyces ingoldianus]KAF2471489.1 hypothetical protein BDR25DRAFT_354744 [Lindgomyces ingoldianus]